MNKDKVLITGANGQLGGEFVEIFKDWQVLATDLDNLDINDKAKVKEIFTKEAPNLIIHCAAWTDVEGCAENPEKAMFINGEGTKNLAEAAKEIGAKMIYISTNEVFDGEKETPYIESDKTNPINPYAVSKLAGEKFVLQALGRNGIIVRTSWVYGPKGKSNFPLKIIAAADKLGELSVVDDEIAVPTYAPDLAKAVFDLVRKSPSGIYHLVNEGSCSRYDWAVEVLKNSGRAGIKVKPTKLKDYQRKSTAPQYGLLSNSKAKELDVILPNWEISSERYISEKNN